MNKKYYLLTLGCQMNKSDAERLAAILEKTGLKATDREEAADVLVVNACSVRQSAIDRVHGKARKWRLWKEKRPGIITILTGCILKEDEKVFEEKFDLVLGIGQFDKLNKFLRVKRAKTAKVDSIKEIDSLSYFKTLPSYQSKFSALVPIMTGCNNFCSYCAVPYVRGQEKSRPVKEVLSEVKNLARKGYLEIIFLGQNVNSYNPPDKKNFSSKNPYRHPFAALLWETNNLPGINRIFFTASHPKDMTAEVIDALKLPKMVNYLHLPAQSGDDGILKKMNRKYTAKDYLRLVKKIRAKRPGIALGTDIIVGFPGETKKQFMNTVKFYQQADFDIMYQAKYSPREGTVAGRFKDDVILEEKKRRWFVLQRLMEKITAKKNLTYEGKVVEVLVDKYSRGSCEGNSREMKRVEFASNRNLIGRVVDVRIVKGLMWILRGEMAKNAKFKNQSVK